MKVTFSDPARRATSTLPWNLTTADAREENTSIVMLHVLKHELRTPINHIIGYSEMLLEDLADGSDPEGHRAMQAVHKAGRELLAVVNAGLGGPGGPNTAVSPEILASLRSAVRRIVDRLLAENLGADRLPPSLASAGDVAKIVEAVTRLSEFAETGKIRNRE